ncbi:MAG TPA: Hsp20/alpha crystallin family protein [Gemmatimonadales bacterium]|jgi:HSP20 family protein|nr:Hsp20/alpha crystallin family protein [Gemmatimonadales bacterium]
MHTRNVSLQRDPMVDLLHQLEHRMGGNFSTPLRTFEWPGFEAASAGWVPLVDIFEEPDVIRLVAEVPGVKPEDVKISVEGHLLTITGTKEQVAEERAEKVHRYERTYGAFERSFTLSTSIDPSKIKATYDLGVLTVTLPKAETAKPHLITVEVAPAKALRA